MIFRRLWDDLRRMSDIPENRDQSEDHAHVREMVDLRVWLSVMMATVSNIKPYDFTNSSFAHLELPDSNFSIANNLKYLCSVSISFLSTIGRCRKTHSITNSPFLTLFSQLERNSVVSSDHSSDISPHPFGLLNLSHSVLI